MDGQDIRTLKLEHLRTQMAVVPQEPFLFAGSIRRNIALGDPELTESQLVEAAGAAAVHDTIQAFPQGYDTVVGEKGIILSGGQKQRIALARALLKPSPLLILDDPISQVDLKTGHRLIETIRAMAGSRTIIISSHRLSAVRFADRIIALDNGRIVESGSHEDLIAGNRYYARMYRLQEIEEDWYAN
jgi:ATP-binding cassette subfamily B protein